MERVTVEETYSSGDKTIGKFGKKMYFEKPL